MMSPHENYMAFPNHEHAIDNRKFTFPNHKYIDF